MPSVVITKISRSPSHHSGSGTEKLVTYPVGQIVDSMNKSRTTDRVVMDMVEEFIDAAQAVAAQLEF